MTSEKADRRLVNASPAAVAAQGRLAERTVAALDELRTRVLATTRTLIVAADGSGQHATITAAMEGARDGDRILVRPGTYEESVAVVRSVEIVGDGDRLGVLVHGTLSFRHVRARIANLSIGPVAQHYGNYRTLGPDSVHAWAGSVTLEDVIMRGSISFDGTSGAVRRCLMGDRVTAQFTDGSSPSIEDCAPESEDYWFVAVNGAGTNPVVRRNHLAELHAGGGACPTIEDNEFRGHMEEDTFFLDIAGEGTNPTVRRNVCELVRVTDGAHPLLEENRIDWQAWLAGSGTVTKRKARTSA